MVSGTSFAQKNLVLNPDALSGTDNWTFDGSCAVEQAMDGKASFVVRLGGGVFQKIKFDGDYTDRYALLIARASSERVDGILTGLPSLYGFLNSPPNEKRQTINTYLTGQHLLGHPSEANEWVVVYGVFKIKPNTISASISLNQAERGGEPQNGSAARFRNVGFYIFETQEAASEYVKQYQLH